MSDIKGVKLQLNCCLTFCPLRIFHFEVNRCYFGRKWKAQINSCSETQCMVILQLPTLLIASLFPCFLTLDIIYCRAPANNMYFVAVQEALRNGKEQ